MTTIENEVYGVCFECGKEGKFIGEEGDDWMCERCCDMCHHGSDSDSDSDSGDEEEERCEYCENTEDLCECVKCYGCGKNITEEYEDWFDEHADDEWREPECECEKCDRLVSYGCSTSTDTVKFLLTQGWKRDDEYIHQLVRAN